jgi:hypothetical protein
MNVKGRIGRRQKSLKDHPESLLMNGQEGLNSTELLFIAEVNRRAEIMTPLLKELLAFRPSPHWK